MVPRCAGRAPQDDIPRMTSREDVNRCETHPLDFVMTSCGFDIQGPRSIVFQNGVQIEVIVANGLKSVLIIGCQRASPGNGRE